MYNFDCVSYMRRDYAMFVYPGSINRVSDRIFKELQNKATPDTTVFREVFAGSGIASIDMALEHPHMQIQMNDLDEYMFAFWDLVATGTGSDDDKLKNKLEETPTLKLFDRLRAQQNALGRLSRVTRAYHAVFFHRCTYGGVFFNGPRGGRSQEKGTITACYNASNLKLVYDNLVALFRGRMTATNMDAVAYIKRFMRSSNDLWFLDPPWIERGVGWYPHSMDLDEHLKMARLLKRKAFGPRRWLMIIGDHSSLADLYSGCRIRVIKVTRGAGPSQGLAVHRDKLIDGK